MAAVYHVFPCAAKPSCSMLTAVDEFVTVVRGRASLARPARFGRRPRDAGRSIACPSVVIAEVPLRSVANTSSAKERADDVFVAPLYSATAAYQPPSADGNAPPVSFRA